MNGQKEAQELLERLNNESAGMDRPLVLLHHNVDATRVIDLRVVRNDGHQTLQKDVDILIKEGFIVMTTLVTRSDHVNFGIHGVVGIEHVVNTVMVKLKD